MSLLPRLIARLDIKGQNVVKGVHMEGLRVVGKPAELSKRYAAGGCVELLYMDIVASLYGRPISTALITETVDNDVFVPICVGGGVNCVADTRKLLHAGADKIALNTAAIKRPQLITDLANKVGNQAIVVSVEAKRINGHWEAYTDNGRERTGKDAVRWAIEASRLGAGELLLTSIDMDGTRKGFDLDLIAAVAPNVAVQVIACGGMGTIEHAKQALYAGACGIACGTVLHYNTLTIKEIADGLFAESELRTERGSEARGSDARPEG